MSPILWIWRASIEARLGVLTETDEDATLDFKHDLAKLLQNPNPFLSGRDDASYHRLMVHRWQRLPVEGPTAPASFVNSGYVPHWMMEPMCNDSDQHDFISWVQVHAGRAVSRLKPSEVVHLKYSGAIRAMCVRASRI